MLECAQSVHSVYKVYTVSTGVHIVYSMIFWYALSVPRAYVRSKCAQYTQSVYTVHMECALGVHSTHKFGRGSSPGESPRPLSTLCEYYAYFCQTLCVLFRLCVHDVRTCAYHAYFLCMASQYAHSVHEVCMQRKRYAQYA